MFFPCVSTVEYDISLWKSVLINISSWIILPLDFRFIKPLNGYSGHTIHTEDNKWTNPLHMKMLIHSGWPGVPELISPSNINPAALQSPWRSWNILCQVDLSFDHLKQSLGTSFETQLRTGQQLWPLNWQGHGGQTTPCRGQITQLWHLEG